MLIDLIKANRSYRGYDHSRTVTRDELLKMVEAARFCPSSVNMQPLKYFLAYTPEAVAVIQSETKWAKGLPGLQLPHPGKEPTAFIVICQDTGIDANLSRFQRDVGIVAQTILLTAVEMGLGGCMIGNFNAGSVHDALSLDEQLKPLLIVAVGKPDETIMLTDAVDGKTGYYRDEQGRHYVPKRALNEIVIDGRGDNMAESEDKLRQIPGLSQFIDGGVSKIEAADSIPDPLTVDELEFLPDIDALDKDGLKALLGKLEDLMDNLEDEEPGEGSEAHDEWEESIDEVTDLMDEVESRIEETEEDE